MYIRELKTDRKFVTVTLDYDEVRCINNSLYELSEIANIKREHDFDIVRKKFVELFALIKHGHIPAFELDIMHKLLNKKEGV